MIESDDLPIVRYLQTVLADAIQAGASDIHFEPYEKTYRVRFRQDGLLHALISPPQHFTTRLASCLKVMSRLDIAEKRLPQDGRFTFALQGDLSWDIRVSTCPTLYGEKVVLRILDTCLEKLNIDYLGMEDHQKTLFLKAICAPQGMVLVTGPTGSGKTVTLYSALHALNTEQVNISSAEDPVEIHLPGINQVSIHPKAGLTFATILRSFLRQDPDIMMLGEIRDLETAEIALKAAQTGHLVLSTLHTNSAPETIMRLCHMGVLPFHVATSLSLVVAQRLVRRLCGYCKGKHCDQCKDGYKGRIGIYEVMPISGDLAQVILRQGNALEIAAQAKKEGMISLREAGMLKVELGLTSVEEVYRMTT